MTGGGGEERARDWRTPKRRQNGQARFWGEERVPAGYWLLATGYWLLAAGCWLLAAGRLAVRWLGGKKRSQKVGQACTGFIAVALEKRERGPQKLPCKNPERTAAVEPSGAAGPITRREGRFFRPKTSGPAETMLLRYRSHTATARTRSSQAREAWPPFVRAMAGGQHMPMQLCGYATMRAFRFLGRRAARRSEAEDGRNSRIDSGDGHCPQREK